jgi:hypothetical protein
MPFFGVLNRGIAMFPSLIGVILCFVVVAGFVMSSRRVMMFSGFMMLFRGIDVMFRSWMFKWHGFLLLRSTLF